MKKKIIFTLFLLITGTVSASPTLIYDPKLSPYMGAEDIYFAQRTLEAAEDYCNRKNQHSQKWYLQICRAIDLIGWGVINSLEDVTQHEFFGHGYRLRDLDDYFFDVKYKINFFSGDTHYYFYPDQINPFLEGAVALGGIESELILSHRLTMHYLENQKFDARQQVLYLKSHFALLDYAKESNEEEFYAGNDIHAYVIMLNGNYPNSPMTVREIRKKSLVALIDPLTYYAFYSPFKYIFKGARTHIPMIPLTKDLGYLFSFKTGLTPFGLEYYSDHYFSWKNRGPFYAYFKWGEHAGHQYYGLGMEYPKVYSWASTSLGFTVDLWLQPQFIFHPGFSYSEKQYMTYGFSPEELHKKILGVSLYLMAEQKLWKSPFALVVQLGGKSAGYLPGESLKAAGIFRIGTSANF